MKQLKNVFTLVEFLVVISIIMILTSILMPALTKAKETAREIVCKNQQKQLHGGFFEYTGDYKEYMPIATTWAPQLNPYVGNISNVFEDGIYKITVKGPNIFKCPSEPKIFQDRNTNYAYNDSLGLMDPIIYYKIVQVRTPSLCLFMACIRNNSNVVTGNDHTATYSIGTSYFEVNKYGWAHRLGANYSFVDGHVQWYKIHKLTVSLRRGHVYRGVKT